MEGWPLAGAGAVHSLGTGEVWVLEEDQAFLKVCLFSA